MDSDATKMNDVLAVFAKDVEAEVYVMRYITTLFISKDSIQK